jgi:hypothetical protein
MTLYHTVRQFVSESIFGRSDSSGFLMDYICVTCVFCSPASIALMCLFIPVNCVGNRRVGTEAQKNFRKQRVCGFIE